MLFPQSIGLRVVVGGLVRFHFSGSGYWRSGLGTARTGTRASTWPAELALVRRNLPVFLRADEQAARSTPWADGSQLVGGYSESWSISGVISAQVFPPGVRSRFDQPCDLRMHSELRLTQVGELSLVFDETVCESCGDRFAELSEEPGGREEEQSRHV